MPPTTRSMIAGGVVAPEEYAVRQKKAKKPQPEPHPNMTKHGQIGFDRKRLQIGGALESDAAKTPTLANKVLRLFRRENFFFDNETLGFNPVTGGFDSEPPPPEWDEAYENMEPAFRLVSRWMTDPIFQSFWDILVNSVAHRADSEHPERRMNWEIEWQERDLDSLMEDSLMEDSLMEDSLMEDDLPEYEIPGIFDWLAHSFKFQPISHAWAETRSQSNPLELRSEYIELENGERVRPGFISMTFLHEDFFHLSYTDFPKATKSQQLRFLYFLAVTVAHEVAHLIWQHNWAQTQSKEEEYDIKNVLDWEPYFVHDDFVPRVPSNLPHNELGIVWEWFMFGGRIQPLNQSLSPFVPDGLVILPMDMVRHTYFWDPQCRIAPLRTSWISDQFSEAWWQRKGSRAALARQPRRPRLAPDRATVNRTIDSSVFQENEYDIGGEAQRVAEHVLGGSPGHRIVRDMVDTWLLTGVVEELWRDYDSFYDSSTESESESESE